MNRRLRSIAIAGLLLLAGQQARCDMVAGSGAEADTASRVTTHEWLYGVGRSNVLDTYLSPLEYTGPALGVSHRSERTARWGRGRVIVQGYFAGRGAYLRSAADNHKEWDAELTAAVAWLRRWQPAAGWLLAAGGTGSLSGGFTYNTANGNNPAQGRLAADIGLTALTQYGFRIGRVPLALRSQAEAPMLGFMFSPRYGQSYYEIFSLGHSDRNVCLTHPFNAPSLRWTTTLRLRCLGATLSVGYMADIRQSHVNNLKRHAWTHQFVVGYVRRLRLIR